MRKLKLLLITILTLVSSMLLAEVETTIVVVNGQALLVDIDDAGNVVKTYMIVDNYFSSDADHETKVAEAKSQYVMLTKRQLDQIRFIALTETPTEIDDAMATNLSDLSMHYHETYANEIIITAAKNRQTQNLLEENIKLIKKILTQYGVFEHDIRVQYKIDKGDEPTQFIKVVSHLQDLPTQ